MENIQELIDEYYSESNQSYIKDGIVNADDYLSSPLKILWILKEPHAKDKSASWDHRGFLGWAMVDAYPRWKTTHGPIVRTSYALVNQIKNINSVKHINEFSKEEIYKQMRMIALINVKKSLGNSSSDYKVISAEYQKSKDILLKQIDLIQPDIIINCSRVWEIFCDLGGKNASWEDGFGFIKGGRRIVIHAFHPQARYKKNEKNILAIVNKMQDITQHT